MKEKKFDLSRSRERWKWIIFSSELKANTIQPTIWKSFHWYKLWTTEALLPGKVLAAQASHQLSWFNWNRRKLESRELSFCVNKRHLVKHGLMMKLTQLELDSSKDSPQCSLLKHFSLLSTCGLPDSNSASIKVPFKIYFALRSAETETRFLWLFEQQKKTKISNLSLFLETNIYGFANSVIESRNPNQMERLLQARKKGSKLPNVVYVTQDT